MARPRENGQRAQYLRPLVRFRSAKGDDRHDHERRGGHRDGQQPHGEERENHDPYLLSLLRSSRHAGLSSTSRHTGKLSSLPWPGSQTGPRSHSVVLGGTIVPDTWQQVSPARVGETRTGGAGDASFGNYQGVPKA
ncbi:hypothetical protein Skr01_53760 [Sphaerisporangium krabiense]|nr:hypothetical protein Skr01_53760 [Sphaerisporangium krabiense]